MNIRKTARLIILDELNRILLMQINPGLTVIKPRRRLDKPYWLTPGGGVKEGETLCDAARRELFEETGIAKVELSEKHVWYGEILFLNRKGIETRACDHFFIVRVRNDTPITIEGFEPEEKEIFCRYKWWSLKEINASDDLFVPHGLAGLLDPIVSCNEIPQNPKNIELIVPKP